MGEVDYDIFVKIIDRIKFQGKLGFSWFIVQYKFLEVKKGAR